MHHSEASSQSREKKKEERVTRFVPIISIAKQDEGEPMVDECVTSSFIPSDARYPISTFSNTGTKR